MALQPQLVKLVERLTELTRQSKITWEATADEDTFLTSAGKFVVTLGKEGSGDSWGSPFDRFRFRVLDGSGKTIDEGLSGPYHEERLQLEGLHELARRSALDADEALSDLLSSLEHI